MAKTVAVLVMLFLGLQFVATAHAAELFFASPWSQVPNDKPFEVAVLLNTQEDTLNAVEGSVTVSPANAVQQVIASNSAINLWITDPAVDPLTGSVSFSGVTPGGFKGPQTVLFNLVLKAGSQATVSLDARGVRVLKNDGSGTQANLVVSPITFQVSTTGDVPGFEAAPDKDAPEPFTVTVTKDSNLLDGKYVAIFSAQDKGSGLDHYEALETSGALSDLQLKQKLPWKTVASPYEIRDQRLEHYLYIRAIDRAGNVRVAVVTPTHPMPWYRKFGFELGLAALLLVLLIGWVVQKILRRSHL